MFLIKGHVFQITADGMVHIVQNGLCVIKLVLDSADLRVQSCHLADPLEGPADSVGLHCLVGQGQTLQNLLPVHMFPVFLRKGFLLPWLHPGLLDLRHLKLQKIHLPAAAFLIRDLYSLYSFPTFSFTGSVRDLA